jgi:NADH-quinone oxidoreductase subunit M
MVILTTFLFVVAVLISFNVTNRPKEYFAWLLALETGVMGVFTAQDLILFFLFWEVELLPMFFLISIWGSGRKEYSALKFVLFTITGSALMLAGFLVLAFSAEPSTFDMQVLRNAALSDSLLPLPAIFFLIFAAFAIKLPIVPVHTWLPDAHTDAPTAVSVILAGVLLKMGGYGMLRILVGIMPDTASDYALTLAIIAAVSIIYGALITLRQRDLKRLIAYSSVSHMGYVLLGIAALDKIGLTGATLQMFSHGMITGLLFVMVGLVYDRTHTRNIDDLSGLAHVTPVIATGMLMAGLASLGLPAMSGFVAEATVFFGAADRFEAPTIVAVVGIVLTAGYILWMIQRVMFGPRNERWADMPDATSWWEQVPVAAMLAVIIAVGIYPAQLVDVIDQGIIPLASRFS